LQQEETVAEEDDMWMNHHGFDAVDIYWHLLDKVSFLSDGFRGFQDGYTCISDAIVAQDWTAPFTYGTSYFSQLNTIVGPVWNASADSYALIDASIQSVNLLSYVVSAFAENDFLWLIPALPRILDSYWRLYVAVYF